MKYDYNMDEYVRLPKDCFSKIYDVYESEIKSEIGTELMQLASEYAVQKGDKIQVDIEFYEALKPEASKDAKGEKIDELSQKNLWIEQVGKPYSDGGYQISAAIENAILGAKMNEALCRQVVLDDGFFAEKYRGQRIFADVTVNNRLCQMGDVVLASYTGYYLDENGQLVIENGQEKIFDASDREMFFIGSHLAADDFENGLVGLGLGQERDVYVSFPSDGSENKRLAGQRALFKVKIEAFYVAPTYNDEFVRNHFSCLDTTAEFEASLEKECAVSAVYRYINDNARVLKYPTLEYDIAESQLERVAVAWNKKYDITLDRYIQSCYGMTRDEYIKSKMKTEMIFYALRNMIEENAFPTKDELDAERNALIEGYKDDYMMSEGLIEGQAIAKATEYVDALGEAHIYEQVMYKKIDNLIPTLVKTTVIPSENDCIWESK